MPPRSIAIEPTNACNLKCSICYSREGNRPIGFMNMELFREIIDEAVKLRVRRIGLNFAGGTIVTSTV
jgi:sulfatase maturation enzyme AslB (radical SAM superfamily)